MSDVFEPGVVNPSADRDPYLGMTTDGMLTVAMALLIAPGGICAALSAFTGVFGVIALFVDIPTSPGDPPMAVIGLLECAVFLIPTGLYLGAAVGVYLRAKWGWVLAIIGFAFWMTGCCAPFGGFGLYALLREPGRKAFGLP